MTKHAAPRRPPINVLIIAYHAPPKCTAGTFRTARYLEYLQGEGIAPIVLTTSHAKPWPIKWLWYLPTGLLCLIKKLLGYPYDVYHDSFKFVFIDREWGWLIPAYRKARDIIKKNNIDIIYVSTPPHSSAYLGYVLKKKTGLPLILDMRDFWTQDYFNPTPYKPHRYARLEKKILRVVDKLITTSWSDLSAYQSVLNDKVHLIFNGYDIPPPILYCADELKTFPAQGVFTIVYLGNWNTPFRSPDTLLKALSTCNFPWRFISIGQDSDGVKRYAQRYGVLSKVICQPAVSQTARYYHCASAFFLCQGEFTPRAGISSIACKTMDYVATGKPIIAELPEGDNKRFLQTYSQQYHCIKPHDVENCRLALRRCYAAWRKAPNKRNINSRFLHQFNGNRLTQQLANLIKSVYQEQKQ